MTANYNLKRLFRCLDSLFTISVIPMAIALLVYWSIQYPTISSILETPRIAMHTQDTKHIQTTVLFSPEVKKVAYDFCIRDEYGNIVFRYPRFTIERSTGADPNMLTIKFPTGMGPGVYSIDGTAYYQLNPLQTTDVKFEMAKVTVLK